MKTRIAKTPRGQRKRHAPGVVQDSGDTFAAAVAAAALNETDPEFRAALLALVEADRQERKERRPGRT